MTDVQLLTRAVLHSPDDDGARLALADALDYSEPNPLAEFIRLQCASARYGATDAELARIRQLLHDHGKTMFASLPGDYRYIITTHNYIDTACGRTYHIQRGFVHSIRVKIAQFMEPAFISTVFGSHPVTSVTLADRSPMNYQFGYCYFPKIRTPTTQDRIEGGLFELLTGGEYFPFTPSSGDEPEHCHFWRFDTRELALQALSRACVAYARNLLNLPRYAPAQHAP
jgi:uncharacterized protein (TIGR02996 family)